MSEPELPQELNALAESLRSLRPRCELPNRDRLMYEAGRRSARGHRLWPAMSGMLAAALVVSLWTRPISEPITIVDNGKAINADGPNYIHTRNAVLRDGLDALPRTAPADAPTGNIPTLLSSRFHEDV